MKRVAFAGAFVATLLAAFTAGAAKTNFTVQMSWDQENQKFPDGGMNPIVLNGHDPQGTVDATFDDVTKHLCGTVTWTDLTGPPTGIHLHQAPDNNPEGDGTVKLVIPVPAGNATSASFNFTLSPSFEKSLMAPTSTNTELYVNIHTATNTTGEDRSMTPWSPGTTEVPCGPSTDPVDAGTDAGGTTSGNPIPVPTTTSTTPPANTSSGSTGTSGTSGLGEPTGDQPAPAKKGCSASGSPANALSMAFLAGLGIFAATGRLRRRSKR